MFGTLKPLLVSNFFVLFAKPLFCVEFSSRMVTFDGTGSTFSPVVVVLVLVLDVGGHVGSEAAELSVRWMTRNHTSAVSRVRAAMNASAGSGRRRSGAVMMRCRPSFGCSLEVQSPWCPVVPVGRALTHDHGLRQRRPRHPRECGSPPRGSCEIFARYRSASKVYFAASPGPRKGAHRRAWTSHTEEPPSKSHVTPIGGHKTEATYVDAPDAEVPT